MQQFADRAEVSLGLVSTLERGQGPGDLATYGCEAPHCWANLADELTIVIGSVTAGQR